MRRYGIAAIGLAAAWLAGRAWGSECEGDNYEILTLEVADVTIDGAPAGDLAAWDTAVTLALASDGSLVLDVDGQTTSFESVQP